MEWKNKKVAVTGGGGFLGSHLISILRRKHCGEIISLTRSSQPELKNMGITVKKGDIRDRETVSQAFRECDVVFHTAAKAGIWGRLRDYKSVNVAGTENVIASCIENNVKALVHTSSPSVSYSASENIENATESIPYPEKYQAYYPATKAEAEKKVLKAAGKYIKAVALRPHLIYGPGDPHLLPRIIKTASKGRLLIVGSGENVVDITYVQNAAQAHIDAAEKLITAPEKINGRVFYISDGNPVRIWDWINSLLKECGIPEISRKIPYRKAYALGGILEAVFRFLPFGEPPMTCFAAGQLAHSHYFDISAAKKELGYKPPVASGEAFRATVEWLKKKQAKENDLYRPRCFPGE